MSFLPFDPSEVSRLLLAWYGREGRDLPWRGSRDPYRVWLSEIMLQQTTVQAVIPYFQRFLAAFPDVRALAAAPVEAVIELWAGLGYYSRARHLHAAARMVVEECDGAFPDDLEGLMRLPGVGRSTAGAILSIAFDTPAPILDGNVRRVLCRLFALTEPARSAASEKRLWRWAETLTPAQHPHDYAQAIMDLGATLCTPRNPQCHRCPLAGLCQAHQQGLETVLPLKESKKAVPTVLQVALLLQYGGGTLVRRRPLSGMLAGLWEFPSAAVAEGDEPQRAAADLMRDLGAQAPLEAAGSVRHAYSHFRVDIHVFRAHLDGTQRVAEDQGSWLDGRALGTLALHGAHKKILPLLASPR